MAIKFEAAYLRALDFDPPARRSGGRHVYARYIKGGVPSMPTTRRCRTISSAPSRARRAAWAWRYISTPAADAAAISRWRAANPLLMDSVFNDPTLRKTNFVILHGGSGGFEQFVPYLLMKPNVYADFSEQTWMTSPRHIAASDSRHAGVLSGQGAVRHGPVSLDAAGELGGDGLSDATAGRRALASH